MNAANNENLQDAKPAPQDVWKHTNQILGEYEHEAQHLKANVQSAKNALEDAKARTTKVQSEKAELSQRIAELKAYTDGAKSRQHTLALQLEQASFKLSALNHQLSTLVQAVKANREGTGTDRMSALQAELHAHQARLQQLAAAKQCKEANGAHFTDDGKLVLPQWFTASA